MAPARPRDALVLHQVSDITIRLIVVSGLGDSRRRQRVPPPS
jgi:hypothetical protein